MKIDASPPPPATCFLQHPGGGQKEEIKTVLLVSLRKNPENGGDGLTGSCALLDKGNHCSLEPWFSAPGPAKREEDVQALTWREK